MINAMFCLCSPLNNNELNRNTNEMSRQLKEIVWEAFICKASVKK